MAAQSSGKNESQELLNCAHAYFGTTVCQCGGNLYLLQLFQAITKQLVSNFDWLKYRISANNFRRNYSSLNLTLCTVTGAETIRRNTVVSES